MTREELSEKFGEVWDTTELQRDFVVLAFASPYVLVNRKSDQQTGSLLFQANPRLYYSFAFEETVSTLLKRTP
jgi:hypothetical protein